MIGQRQMKRLEKALRALSVAMTDAGVSQVVKVERMQNTVHGDVPARYRYRVLIETFDGEVIA